MKVYERLQIEIVVLFQEDAIRTSNVPNNGILSDVWDDLEGMF